MMSAVIQPDVQTFPERHPRQRRTDKKARPESETALTNRANFNVAGDLQAGLNLGCLSNYSELKRFCPIALPVSADSKEATHPVFAARTVCCREYQHA
jgi:hypothetical protein